MKTIKSIYVDYGAIANNYIYEKADKYNLRENNGEFENSGWAWDAEINTNKCYIKFKNPNQSESTKKNIVKLFTEKLINDASGKLLDTKLTHELMKIIENKSFLLCGTDTVKEINEKILLRTLTQQEYIRINQQIEMHDSILLTNPRRKYSFAGGSGDVILSETFNKMYCVENDNERDELHKDFGGKCYYLSISGLSGAGCIYTGKKSIVFLPTVRFGISNEHERPMVNGVKIGALSNRGVVDREYPIIVFPKDNSVIDYAFIESSNIQGVIGMIKSRGDNIKNMPIHEHILDGLYNESGKPVEIITRYASDVVIDRKIINNILHFTGKLNAYRNFYNATGSEFDRVLGIYQVGDQYVGKGKYGLITRWFGSENPRVVHNKDKKFMINGRTLAEGGNLAYKKENGVLYAKALEEYNSAYIRSIRVNRRGLMSKQNKIINSSEFGEIRCAIGDIDIVMFANDISFASCKDDMKDLYKKMEVGSADYLEKTYIEGLPRLIEGIVSDLNSSPKLQEKFFSSDQFFENRHKSGSLIYRIINDKVYMCYIIENEKLHKKFGILEKKLQDFEMIVPLNEREEKGLEYYKIGMKHSAFAKSKTEYRNTQKWNTEKQVQLVMEYLGSNLQAKWTLQDSLNVGNCEPSTIYFMEKYDIPNIGILSSELLNHKQINQMLNDSRFRAIFLDKIDI